jgi:hypothetical protein
MRLRKVLKRTCLVLLAIITFLALAYLGLYQYIQDKIAERAPDVTYESLVIRWKVVRLTGVRFNRGWVSGRLQTVQVGLDEVVRVKGGDVQVDLDDRPKRLSEAPTGESTKVLAEDLQVKVQRGEAQGILEGASWDGETVRWAKGTVAWRGYMARFGGGSIQKTGIAKVSQIASVVTLPFSVPTLNLKGLKVQANDLVIDTKGQRVEGKQLEFGPAALTNFEVAAFPDKYELKVKATTIRHSWLDADPSTFPPLDVVWNRNTDSLTVTASSGSVVTYRDQEITGFGRCQEWVGALPDTLLDHPLDKLKFKGDLKFTVSIGPKPKFKLKAACRVECPTLPNLHKPFTYLAYGMDGKRFERKSGPGSADWYPLGAMGEVPMATINFEDPGFPVHSGYINQAFENSLVDNLKLGKFFRGGSTITMQLAKNLWLSRDKTIGRKAQEVLLAMALETCYTKDEILALYLNVVEFGPGIYGVRDGSKHWFDDRFPGELTPVEAFWLASILPRPRKATKPNEAVLAGIKKIMGQFAKDGRIPEYSDEEMTTQQPVDYSEWGLAQ